MLARTGRNVFWGKAPPFANMVCFGERRTHEDVAEDDAFVVAWVAKGVLQAGDETHRAVLQPLDGRIQQLKQLLLLVTIRQSNEYNNNNKAIERISHYWRAHRDRTSYHNII